MATVISITSKLKAAEAKLAEMQWRLDAVDKRAREIYCEEEAKGNEETAAVASSILFWLHTAKRPADKA